MLLKSQGGCRARSFDHLKHLSEKNVGNKYDRDMSSVLPPDL